MTTRTIHHEKTMFDKRKTVTLDLDDTIKEYALYRCEQLRSMGATKVMYRKSSSGNGYHVKAFMEEPVDSLLTRFYLGDDPERLFHDAGHIALGSLQTTNVLLTVKEGVGEADEWTVYSK